MGINKSLLLSYIYINRIVKTGIKTYLKVVNKLYFPIPLKDSELILIKDIGRIDNDIKNNEWFNKFLLKKTDNSPLIKKIIILIKTEDTITNFNILK